MKTFWKYFFPPLYGLLIYSTIRVVNDSMSKDFKFWERPIFVTLIEISTAMVIGYLFMWFIKGLERKYFNKFTREVSVKRICIEILTVVFMSLLIINFAFIPMTAITDDGLSLGDFVQINIIPTLYVVVYFAFRRGNYYIGEYIQSKIQLEKVENEQLQSELDFLKGQFSPHFLFNGLNNIYFQMDKSIPDTKESVEKLSELLRYHLYQDQEKMVPLTKECEFIQLYIDVHKIRKEKNLVVTFNHDKSTTEIYPHLYLPLVENAFKYVEGKNPRIAISVKENENYILFEIENSCRLDLTERSEGIGLKNLKRRLELLYPQNHEFQAIQENNSFAVQLKIKLH